MGIEQVCIDINLLNNLYFIQKLSTHQIAAKLKCSPSTVFYRLRKYGLKLRKIHNGQTLKKYYCIDCKINEINYTTFLYGNKRCHSCEMKLRIGIKASGYKDGRCLKKYYCQDCRKKISSYQAKRCIKCFGIWERGNNNPMYDKTQDKNPNWQGGISKLPYAFEFDSKLKESIRERDNYECQNCGMTEEEHLIVKGQNLSIHHIDYNKKNCKENNLITVCDSCNSRANFNRDYWKNFYQNKISQGEEVCQFHKAV